MLAKIHDKDDKIIACVEYSICNRMGEPLDAGEYCWVNYMWIHRSIKDKYTLKDFVMEEHKKYPLVKWIYYKRHKHKERMSMYDITRFYRRR